MKDYIELTKPRILFLVLITTTIGYYLGAQGHVHFVKLFYLLFGAGAVCAGSATLNHYLEREYDLLMHRTKNRPIPTGKISPANALSFGCILTFAGLYILYTQTNVLTAFLSLLTTFLYVVVYTPMKRLSWLNTSIGAIPGAIPPLGGWAAATGTLDFNAGILFLILFFWQHPHFYAIAWLCKDDYKRGGFKMLPVVEPDGKEMFRQVLWHSIILLPVSILPFVIGNSGWVYFIGAIVSGLLLFKVVLKFVASHSMDDAKFLLRATVLYLPVLLILIILDFHFLL